MWWFGKKKKIQQEADYPIIEVSLEEVKKAIREFEKNLPKGVTRGVLVDQDNAIKFEMLTSQLKGTPNRRFYMSKETYEIFEEEHRHIPLYLDVVQRAVDRYIHDLKSFPVIPSHPHRKINFHLLQKHDYMKEKPPLDFYLTEQENLISHKQPDKQPDKKT